MEISDFFKRKRFFHFWKWKIEKIECTVIINHFSQRISCDSSEFSEVKHPRSVAQTSQKYFLESLLDPGWTRYAGNLWFWCPQISENHEMSDVGAFPAPPQPKTMRETKYLDPKASHEENIFFAENVFSQYFPLFSRPQHPNFHDFGDLAMCPSLL